MELNRLAALKPNFAARKVGDELVLVPVKGSVADMDEMFTLNDVGSLVWDRLEAGVTTSSLVAAIVSEFDVKEETARADLHGFLEQLSGLLNG
ncbi:MAG: PqqD family protein [Flavobacteriales bacterium]|nr:PqqD family protein [Flavobacteriales bacterium]